MPTIDDLNEIKHDLLSIGDEPGILAAKGETPVDIGPPETGLSDDINALLDDFADVEGLEDFNIDMDEDESVLNMDGFDSPESVEESVFDMEGIDEPEPESTVPDSMVPELVEGVEEDIEDSSDLFDTNVYEDDEGDIGPSADDLGFEELIGLTDTNNSDLANAEELDLEEAPEMSFDEADLSGPEELDLEEDLEMSFDEADLSGPEELDLEEDSEMSIDDADLSGLGEFDLEEDSDMSFDDADLSGPEELNLEEESEMSIDDADLSGPEEFDLEEESEMSFDDTDLDSFDLSGTDMDLEGNEELSLDDSDAGDLDLDEFEISDEGLEDDLDIDEFDLGDLGQDFGVLEEDLSSINEPVIKEESLVTEEVFEDEEFSIEENSFERVKSSLQNLPRNLKLIIEEEIGEKGLNGPPLEKLITALAEGKSPKDIASITSKIVGRKIKIPANYSKRTGSDFEEEKGSFQYAFMHRILPLLKIFIISSLILAGLIFVSYKFIYRPVYAYILYNRGFEQLEESNYNSSADLFDQAFDKYKMKKQFYRYADGYIDSNQWDFARSQYEKLLENYPFDKKGTIDYATMDFEKLADYEHSTELLNNYLAEDKFQRDYDALFLLGDIYLEWGWEDYDKYEEARLAYAKIMNTYGVENKVLFRMLRYFIRTDNFKEVDVLKNRFQADSELEINPFVYAELAGYLIDRKDLTDVQELLFRAKDVDSTIPEIHYQLARFFRLTDEGEEEDKALIKTLENFQNIEILDRRNREIKIDTLRRQGERFYIKEEYLQAEEAYLKGIDLLRNSRERNIIKGKSSVFGQLYADLGHIYYYISENPDNALNLYESAEAEGFYSPEIFYNKGNIRYRSEDFRQALLEFYKAAGSFSVNTNLLLATANTLYQRNDYFSAQGYYNHLLDLLELKLSKEFSIRIDERKDHRLLVETLMKAYNNMGVTLYGLFERTGDTSKFSAAMLNFTKSNEYFDSLTRDPETMNRTDMINLAALNQRKMLYPIPEYELQIFADIPKHLDLR